MQFWCVVLFCLLMAFQRTEQSCNQRPNILAFKDCCKMPDLELSKYKKVCSKYLINGPHIMPCSFECVFNAAQALNGSTLVMKNVTSLLQGVLNSTQDYVDAYVAGFEHCAGQEQEMVRSAQRRKSSLDNCSPLASMYSICAHKYVFVHCPADSRSKSVVCSQARDFEIKCEADKADKADKTGRKRG